MVIELQLEALRTSDARTEQALQEISKAICALESFPELATDRENDAKWLAINSLHAAFFYLSCSAFAVRRALD